MCFCTALPIHGGAVLFFVFKMKFIWVFGFFLLPVFAEGIFEDEIEPLLEYYCFDCHGSGVSKGGFSMDEFTDLEGHLGDVDHWLAVWRNLRSQVMPPPEEERPETDEVKLLMSWIEKEVFQLDAKNPDPGRVTIRRLNRMEYHFVMKDLLGVEYRTWENFPADDTGFGFDTIGDALTISPLHMEKYLQAAHDVVEKALPSGEKSQIPLRVHSGKKFIKPKGGASGDWLPFKKKDKSVLEVGAPAEGVFQVQLEYAVKGSPEATSETAEVELWVNDVFVAKRLMGWDQREKILLSGQVDLKKAGNRIEVRVSPKEAAEAGEGEQAIFLRKLRLKGPLDGSFKEYSEEYRQIFVDGPPPEEMAKREVYLAKILRTFVRRAYRRPVAEETVLRLVAMAMEVDREPGKTFRDGLKQAMTAVLASPRFLFRAEIQPNPNEAGQVVELDEFALASRLSFFLWSSQPDEELLRLAEGNELRNHLREQVVKMLADPKSKRFVEQFVGQWLQARDVENLPVDARRVVGIRSQDNAKEIFSYALRVDMRRETELFFEHILKENLSAQDLLTADYSFLNDRLAEFYGVPGVRGREHRLVDLSAHPERGGLLGQGTFLVVSSNPTRTSPVKRGLFVLDNLLGTPAPPAPPDIPELEEAAHELGRNPTMRQMMEVHRKQSLCASCHQRMDPIGLGLENFNAIGQYREKEAGQVIEAAGTLITGENFGSVAELKKVLANDRRADFYRCLSEKMLTYAIGRGPEYYDAVTLEKLAQQMEESGGLMLELVMGIVESAPFQKRRGDE